MPAVKGSGTSRVKPASGEKFIEPIRLKKLKWLIYVYTVEAYLRVQKKLRIRNQIPEQLILPDKGDTILTDLEVTFYL